MEFTWPNLLAYLRWQNQSRHKNDTAYVYADFDDESIGLDGHLDKEGLEEFLAQGAGMQPHWQRLTDEMDKLSVLIPTRNPRAIFGQAVQVTNAIALAAREESKPHEEAI